jgi:phospholipid/cholesterol/gamma-HCH transport system ATP-binding protein
MAVSPLLQVRELAIGAGGRVLHQGLSFELSPGEVLAVVGPSGCGKSTLLRHLAGLERPPAGRVLLADQDLHAGDEQDQAALRRRLGVMFQSGALWSSMSLGENLMLPMRLFTRLTRAQCRDRALARLARVGLAADFDRMPAQLSGGMRKRAALARALALDPELLLLDEPGSGLDPPNAARLDELVRHLRDDLRAAVVLVTHDVASVRAVADRVLFLDDPGAPWQLGPLERLLREGSASLRAFFTRTVTP